MRLQTLKDINIKNANGEFSGRAGYQDTAAVTAVSAAVQRGERVALKNAEFA